MRKVRAHIREGDFSQDPWITKCNDVAEKLAKAAAHGLFQERLQVLMPLLVSAVELQVFLVHRYMSLPLATPKTILLEGKIGANH